MPDKIRLGIHTDTLTTDYSGEAKNTVESFDNKISIDNQLNKLDEWETAKGELQEQLKSLDTADALKKFLENTATNEGYNKHISTHANHISIKIGKHEYAFKAEDETTRVAIHTSLVDFFRTQVIKNKKKEYEESEEFKTATDEEKKTKKEEIEDEFDEKIFEIDTEKLKTTLAPAHTPGTATNTSIATPGFLEDPTAWFKNKSTQFKGYLATASGLIGIVSVFNSGLGKKAEQGYALVKSKVAQIFQKVSPDSERAASILDEDKEKELLEKLKETPTVATEAPKNTAPTQTNSNTPNNK